MCFRSKLQILASFLDVVQAPQWAYTCTTVAGGVHGPPCSATVLIILCTLEADRD
ncbi:hypothetical protein PF005_g18506 [Phytophthora fragariae]|uniref:Uncharacterized protein n=1 Tax=Phytophthora fragariae TaxID=53985 RepID=A0A6A3JF89_9STRA|nr:hypothetical protein PF003_g7428 [Phytophthora fragariae]KAE8930948.1 hypothetical protein PF009_g18976 [Phytophthora fragariae]KAE8993480.1 hypothetical protein PF011_g17129 [Phytophthora fragariae]KAE9076279.1 hypothetical protein PF010_g23962 [Phytophthora fragariae]KAE9091561.1 hypothetical protein PF007_g18832 [Phytophthora fragariae]